MASIIDYIKWRGDLDFDSSPFNPVDNLILSELSYMNFGQILNINDNNNNQFTIEEIAKRYLNGNINLDLGLLLTGEFNLMLDLMSKSNRYSQLIIKNCVEISDLEIETQFFAMTVELNKDNAYIAFRGTDDTLIGWKEDFKMTFLDEVPAQRKALEYLHNVSERYSYKGLFIGGHSKGGNLAVYSAIHADTFIKNAIIKVFNNDGPGFNQRFIDTDNYKEIANRIVTLIPQSSIVGMLLEHEETYLVVKSTQKGVLQHDGFSWEVLGGDFEYLVGVDDDCKMVDMALKKVLNMMTLNQRESFTNILFEIISVNENRTLKDIRKDGIKSLYSMSKNYKKLDKETKKAIHETNILFFDSGFRSFLEVKNAAQWRTKLTNLHKKVPMKFNKRLNKKE